MHGGRLQNVCYAEYVGDVAMKIVGISGSLRQGSINSGLLRAAAELVPQQHEFIIASIREIPLYDGDLEAREGVPAAVGALKDLIAAADGLLIATPEYNNSIPGVLKNAFDWLSRPSADIARVFAGRPVAVMGASPGGFGTALSQNAWLPVLRTLGTQPWFGGRLTVSRAGGLFSAGGDLSDAGTRENLRKFVGAFMDFVERQVKRR
jgi:chromate reductase, NAD(P)H dehydrogenase (quinone)